MFKRVVRLIYVEILKLLNQRFTYVGLVIIALSEFLILEFSDWQRGEVRVAFNGFEFLTKGLIVGNTIGGLFILVLGSMIFSSESTLGTIRSVLTRPVRRSEILFAKMFTIVAFAVLVIIVTFLVAYFFALSESGFTHLMNTSYDPPKKMIDKDNLWAYVGSCLIYSIIPLLAIGCMGLFISIIINNASVAVALSVILFLFSTTYVKMKSNKAYGLFNNYQNFHMETLSAMVERGVMLERNRVERLTNIFEPSAFINLLQFWKWKEWKEQEIYIYEVNSSIYVPIIWIIGFYLASWFFLVKKEILS